MRVNGKIIYFVNTIHSSDKQRDSHSNVAEASIVFGGINSKTIVSLHATSYDSDSCQEGLMRIHVTSYDITRLSNEPFKAQQDSTWKYRSMHRSKHNHRGPSFTCATAGRSAVHFLRIGIDNSQNSAHGDPFRLKSNIIVSTYSTTRPDQTDSAPVELEHRVLIRSGRCTTAKSAAVGAHAADGCRAAAVISTNQGLYIYVMYTNYVALSVKFMNE